MTIFYRFLSSCFSLLFIWGFAINIFAQNGQLVVVLTTGQSPEVPVGGVNVKLMQANLQMSQQLSDSLGQAQFNIPIGNYVILIDDNRFDKLSQNVEVKLGPANTLKLKLKDSSFQLAPVTVRDSSKTTRVADRANPFDQISPLSMREISTIPGPGQSIERMLMMMGGVATSSEFSSQYRVRGGNFDENLIYINDIEIYRPQIVRTGQQEGLSITNASLAEDVTFSTGGFGAKYGDKLSSVLNIQYKNPTSFGASAELGLLTANVHLEGSSLPADHDGSKGRWSYVVGARRFSTNYLLRTLDTQGDYRPTFWDGQGVVTYAPRSTKYQQPGYKTRANGQVDTIYYPREPLKISLLTIMTRSRFTFFPQNRETTFGTLNRAFRLFIAFIGQEETNYTTGQGAFSVDYRPTFRLHIKHIFSSVISEESELTSVEGGYRLGDVNTSMGSDQFNEVVNIRGVGTEILNSRNFLSVRIWNVEQKGEYKLDRNFYKQLNQAQAFVKHTLNWGLRFQYEQINDQLREWSARDSADYLTMDELIRSVNDQNSYRVMAYLQETWRLNRKWTLNSGVRGQYWSLNQQTLLSPRIQIAYEPAIIYDSTTGHIKHQLQLRWAVGRYAQPPFYRELRAFNGTLFPATRAQESIHFIMGADYLFRSWGRSFKLFAEIYYKQLNRIIPYEIENVRLRYYPQQTGTGYARGIDLRVNGQFIKDIDSWFSFSILDTKEDVSNDGNGLVRRPSDQRVIATFYFQDKLPKFPTFKVHINYVFNSGLPFGAPRNYAQRTAFQAPSYNRVDIGLSKVITFRTDAERKSKYGLRSLWVGLEVFNLFQRPNVVSFTWIEDIYDTRFGVPNYLSARLINLRVIARI